MDRGAWWAIVHGASESRTQLNEPVCMRVHTLSLPPTLLPCPSTRRPSLNLNWGASPGEVPHNCERQGCLAPPHISDCFFSLRPQALQQLHQPRGGAPLVPLAWMALSSPHPQPLASAGRTPHQQPTDAGLHKEPYSLPAPRAGMGPASSLLRGGPFSCPVLHMLWVCGCV